ncbi:MAG: hypothetical protein H0W70_12900 [Actinobacteria bacterium]|nr:hypothetical protein [Actinomycetota bacterium]
MSRRRRAARALVATLLFACAGAVVTAGAARAQAAPATPVKVTKQGYFTHKITGSLPRVLVKEVPPAPACLVLPQLCAPEVDALKTALSLNDGLPLPNIPDFLVPQPIPPGELPVGMIGGATRYTSLLQFVLPSIPAKSVVNKFELVIKDGSLAFSITSPAFRQAILAVLSQYPEQQPEVVDRFVADVTAQHTALGDFTPTGIEACMVTGAWEGGANQDPAKKPPTDCIVGGLGKHDDGAKAWTFDISGMVQAWVDGTPNIGVSLSPLGAQNVAYGDADPSTNFILTLASGDGDAAPRARFDVGPPPVTESLDAVPDTALGAPLDSSGGVAADTSSSSGSVLGDVGVPSQAGSAVIGSGTKAKLASTNVGTAWWIWLAIPMVIAGCVALSQAIDAAPNLATRRPGALTRLTAGGPLSDNRSEK